MSHRFHRGGLGRRGAIDEQLVEWLERRLVAPRQARDAGARSRSLTSKPPGAPAREEVDAGAMRAAGLGSAAKGYALLKARAWTMRRLKQKQRRLDEILAELECDAAFERRMRPTWLEVDGAAVLDSPERLAPLAVIARF